MPTETQKQFRKQMKELEKEMEGKDAPEVYSYVQRDFVNPISKFKRKSAITLSGIMTVIFLCIYIFNNARGLSSIYIVNNQSRVVEYVQRVDIIEEPFRVSMADFEKAMSSQNKDIALLTQCKADMVTYLRKLKEVPASGELEELKELDIKRIEDFSKAIDYYIEGYTKKMPSYINIGNTYIDQYRVDSDEMKKVMLGLFDKHGIKYKIEGGTIHYTYRDNREQL